MAFDRQTLEILLRQPEGPALDFKQEQYRFVGEDNYTKSELLKDILAFANSWRNTTGYILIGVKEVKGGRSEIVGVSNHIEDADLHAFVNNKTQRPVNFAYFQFQVDGVEIGVIEIPVQRRPIFLTKKFGKVEANVVWARDGSGSKPMDPDQIVDIGAASDLISEPQFRLEWGTLKERKTFPQSHKVISLELNPLLPLDTFQPKQPRGYLTIPDINPDYSGDLITYVARRNFFVPIGFHLRNTSSTVGKRIRFTGHVPKSEGLNLLEWLEDIPSPKSAFFDPSIPDIRSYNDEAADLELKDIGDRWEVIINFGDVRPHDSLWTDSSLYIGSIVSTPLTLKGVLRGDNLSEPIKCELQVQIETERRAMTVDDVRPFLKIG